MGGFIGSFKGSLRTLIGWSKQGSVTSSASLAQGNSFSQLTNERLSQLPQAATETSKTAAAEESVMANKFVSVLETIGKDFLKGLTVAVTFALPVAKLAGLIFPAAAPAATEVADAVGLIQNAVLLVEQKYAASGIQNGTGPQKLAEVVTLVGPVVISLLKQAGVTADSNYVASLTSAVVAILNVQVGGAAPVTTATA